MAKEAKDSLQSQAMIAIVDLIGEGVIGGLVDGTKSIYLNDTPITNADGSTNFTGATYEERKGTNDQAPMTVVSGIETPFSVGVQVKKNQPKTVTITNPNADKVRVIVTTSALYDTNKDNGDINGTSVEYKFEISTNGGAYQPAMAGEAWSVSGAWLGGEPGYTREATASGSTAKGISATIALFGTEAGSVVLQPQYYDGANWVNFDTQHTITVTPGQGYYDENGGLVSNSAVEKLTVERWDTTKIRFQIVSMTNAPGLSLQEGTIQTLTPQATITMSGKTRSQYQRAHLITLPKPGSTWDIRMTRITPDSTSSYLANSIYFDSYVEIVNTQLRYPNSAVIGIKFDSHQFTAVPRRAYLVDGLQMQVPANYDPVARTYTGIWDGTFKTAATSNPAWIMYALLTHKRYGLGEYIAPEQVDSAKLYQIAKYCDELVPDGFGNQEPRFQINTVIQTQAEAYKLISDIASAFRGMAYWSGGQSCFTQDCPTDPTMIYSPANVIDGLFTYTGSARKDRHSVVLVTWNDPAELYKQKIEYVEDPEMVSKFGVRKTDIVAFGCTSRGQAHRVGKWLLYTERFETDMITFSVGIDSALVVPGDVIRINDPTRAGKRAAGRLVASTTTTAKLDAPYTIDAAPATLNVRLSDGSFVQRILNQPVGTYTDVSWPDPLPEALEPNAMYLIETPNLAPVLARVVGISQSKTNSTEFSITAISHDPTKYAWIDEGIRLEKPPTTVYNTDLVAITELVAQEVIVRDQFGILKPRVEAWWNVSDVLNAKEFDVTYKFENGNWVTFPRTKSRNFEIQDSKVGTYTIKVTAYNQLGMAGPPAETLITTKGTDPSVPADIYDLVVDPWTDETITAHWSEIFGSKDYHIRITRADNDATIDEFYQVETRLQYPITRMMEVLGGTLCRAVKIKVKARTESGVESMNWAIGNASNPQIAAPTLYVTSGMSSIACNVTKALERDYAGTMIWGSADEFFTPDSSNLLFDGTSNFFMVTDVSAPMYFYAAHYDKLGKDNLNYSNKAYGIPMGVGGIKTVHTLPTDPSQVDNEMAIYLDVPDTKVRGIYGWDGTQWVRVANLVPEEISGAMLQNETIDFTKLALGAVRANNLAVKKHFMM